MSGILSSISLEFGSLDLAKASILTIPIMSGVTNDEDQAAFIHFKVKIQDDNEVLFRMKRSTKLKKLMYAYSDRLSVPLDSFCFMFDGRRIHGDWTPDHLGMEEGDEIDALPTMMYNRLGGFKEVLIRGTTDGKLIVHKC